MRSVYCGTDRLPDRAPLLAPAADLAARDDRDRRRTASRSTADEKRQPAAPADRRLPVRALHPEGLPRPEDVLDRGARRDRPDARRGRHARRSETAPEEVVLGMAHRGRLSVLAHNLGRSVESIFAEFEGAKAIDAVKAATAIPHGGTGDVKYHHGAEGMFDTRDGEQIKMRLYPNPSHLEFVDPVVEGGTRADQTGHTGPNAPPQPGVGGAGAAARRRRLPRPGGRRRDAQPAGARRLLDRRHDPHHPEQPGGLHDRPDREPLDPLRRRHGEGLQRPDHPRQRRRRRGLHRRRPGWRWPIASDGAATSSST